MEELKMVLDVLGFVEQWVVESDKSAKPISPKRMQQKVSTCLKRYLKARGK